MIIHLRTPLGIIRVIENFNRTSNFYSEIEIIDITENFIKSLINLSIDMVNSMDVDSICNQDIDVIMNIVFNVLHENILRMKEYILELVQECKMFISHILEILGDYNISNFPSREVKKITIKRSITEVILK